jgi:hypothetical protein
LDMPRMASEGIQVIEVTFDSILMLSTSCLHRA